MSLYALRFWLAKLLEQSLKIVTNHIGDNTSNQDFKDEANDALILFQVTEKQPYTMLKNYKLRSPELKPLSFFEYYQLVTIVRKNDQQAGDIDFDAIHLKFTTKTQRLARSLFTVKLVVLTVLLSTNESAKKTV